MNVQTLAGLASEVQSTILWALSLLCCFGVVHFLCKTGFRRMNDTNRLLLAGGAAVPIWLSLFYRPVFVFVPILLFILVCAISKESQG